MITALISAHAAGMLAKSSGITLDPIAKPLAAVLAFFYSLIPNYGIAIVMLTVAMMIVLTPLSIKQTRSMLVMQKLQPQLKRLQETHKNDRQAMNEAVMALYKEHGASPLGGCLPMLLPLPVFIALLRVLEGLSRKVRGVSQPKYLSSHTRMYTDIVHAMGKLDSFGMDLAKSARTINGSFVTKLPYFVLLLLMVGTQYYQQAQLTSRNPQASSQPGQAAMMKFIPLFFGLISIQFPAGVVIYWTVSNMIRILSQTLMYRYDPKVKALATQDIKEVEATAREIEAGHQPDKPNERPRFRDLLRGAAEGGKGAAKPASSSGSDKPPPGKSAAKPLPPSSRRPSAQKPGGIKPGAPKPGAPKPGAPKPGAPKPAAIKPGATKAAGTAKPGAPKAGTPPIKSNSGGNGAPGQRRGAGAGGAAVGGPKPAGAKPSAPASKNGSGAKPAAAASPPAKPAGDVQPPSGGNGSAGNGAPGKGRTGAGSARNVVNRHRRARKGR